MQEAANLKASKAVKEIIALCIGPKGYFQINLEKKKFYGLLWHLELTVPSMLTPL
jgi:hypothetical protein